MGDNENGSLDNAASETAVEKVTSKFFCGASWGELVENCDTAKPCPSGTNAECEGGMSCFANTPCGKSDASPANEANIEGGQYQKFIDVKNNNPGTKVMIAVGGWTHNDPDNKRLYRFSKTLSTQMSRMLFAQSLVAFMRKYVGDSSALDIGSGLSVSGLGGSIAISVGPSPTSEGCPV